MKDIKSAAPRAPRSQLHAAGANAPVAPTSQLALFVAGDIKGGEAAHNYRMTVVATAIREALKGNSRALVEATDLCKGKSKKARSYAAGFAAVGIPARVQYAGKLDAPENEAVRAQIAALCKSLEFDFESAFLTAFTAPVEPKAPKAKAPAADADDSSAADSAPAADDSATDDKPVVVADLLVSELVTSTITAIGNGSVLADELDAIEKAIALYRANVATLAALEKVSATEAATV